jgi:Domain of unknown function (DUF4160)
MPTILRVGPYRLFFYASDRAEPMHVHVEGRGGTATFWLEPVRLHASRGFARHEVSRLQRLVIQHRENVAKAWHAYFGR